MLFSVTELRQHATRTGNLALDGLGVQVTGHLLQLFGPCQRNS